MATVLVLWVAKGVALWQVPYQHHLPYPWLRLPLNALDLAKSELVLAAGLGAVASAIVALTRRRPLQVGVLALLALALNAMVLVNTANIELLRVFGAPLSAGLILYSDVLGSENGRIAVLSWMPSYVIATLALALLTAALAPPLLLRVGARLGPRRRSIVGAVAVTSFGAALLAAAQLDTSYLSESYEVSGTWALLASLRGVPTLDPALATAEQPASAAPMAPGVPLLAGADKRPVRNVVVVVLESVAAGYLDVYGAPFAVTPQLSSLAADTLLVRHAYAHGVSSHISLAAMLSSTLPWISRQTITSDTPDLPLTLLPELLRRHGLRTAFFHASDTRHSGVDRFLARAGFDRVEDYRGRECTDGYLVDLSELHSQATTDACTFRSLQQWIRAEPERPFFAMLWTFQQHYPYFRTGSPRRYRFPDLAGNVSGLELKTRYLDAIAEADALIGSLIDDLRRGGRWRDTLVVVVGDHGEAFQQHGSFGHGAALYEEDVHVPLLLLSPDRFPRRTTDRLVGHVDLAPSILDLLGLPVPEDWQGQSLFRPAPARPVHFFSAWMDYVVGARDGDRKTTAHLLSGRIESYDLAHDPGERHDLAVEESPAANAERDRLLAWARRQNRFLVTRLPGKRLAPRGLANRRPAQDRQVTSQPAANSG